jgi:hypothetical protein
MKIYYVAEVETYYDTDEYEFGEIITEETPLLDKGIFANAADAIVLVGDLLREKKAEWERYSDCDPVIVGKKVYARHEDMETFPACFTAYTVREREVIGS